MEKNENVKKVNDEINDIINSIKIIDSQIKDFEEKKLVFFRKKNYNQRINGLECVRTYLLRRLEYKLNNDKNYHE